ncbi:MAG: 2Fe-2S iron-sulfur cluster binding domain-containing protein [Planctomycetota bacterium]
MPKLILANEGMSLEIPAGTNLRQALLARGINVYPPMRRFLNCHGLGLCGTCKVEVSDPRAVEPAAKTRAEKKHTFDVPDWSKIRLSCQCKVAGDMIVKTSPRLPLAWYKYPTYQHLLEQPGQLEAPPPVAK